MKFRLKPLPKPEEIRILKKFAWIPKKIDREVIWFEYYFSGQQVGWDRKWHEHEASLKELHWDDKKEEFIIDDTKTNKNALKDALGVKK